MANLKDTIVLGNLTVTGSIVASDILVSETGNEFDTIKVNKIIGQGNGTYTLEIEAIAENGVMKINTSYIDLTGDLHTRFISDSDSDNYSIELGVDNSIDLSSAGDINLFTSNEDGNGQIYLNCNQVAIEPVTGTSVSLGLAGGGYFTMHENGSISISDTVGGGCAFYPTGGDTSLGSSNNKWNQAHINEIRSYNGSYYVSLSASGLSKNTSSITANIGSSSVPFNNIYGTNFYASSDMRLKENIVNSHFDYYSIINKIQLVNYTWKSDEQHILHHGLIAQQLKEILPEELHNHLISESAEEEKIMSVNDGKLIYFALGALQQQLQINNKLEQRIQKLEKELFIRGDK